MAIDIDVLIPTTSTVVNNGFTGRTLAGLFATHNAIIPYNNTQKVLQFTNATDVGSFFGLASSEYATAVTYFKAYDNTTSIPPYVLFGRYVDTNIAPYIRGGAGANLATLNGITSGSVTFEFNGASMTSTGAAVSTSTLPVDQVEWTDGTHQYLTVVNQTSATIGTYKLVSNAWVLQGSTVATGTAPTGIAFSNIGGSYYVSVTNGTDATVETYLWSGSAFASIGSAVATGTLPTQVVSFTIGANQYIAFTNNEDDTFTTQYWTGTAFANIAGTPTVATGADPTYLTQYVIGGVQYISIVNADDATVSTYSWDGAKFVSVGSAVATGTAPKGIEAYQINGFTYYTVVNSGDNTIGTYLWSGTIFVSIGTAVATGTLPNDVAYFTINSQNYLVVTNTTSATMFTYLWNGTTWVHVSSVATGTAPTNVTTYYVSGTPYATAINSTAATFSTYDFIVSGTTISGINLSSAGSFSQVASILQAAYIAAGVTLGTVTYDSITNAFTVSNGDVSGTGTVTYSPVTALATALELTQANGAVLSQGSVALSAAANLTGFLTVTRNWFTFTNMWDLSSDPTYAVQLAFAAWVKAQTNPYAYALWTVESNLEVPGNNSNIANALVTNGYGTGTVGTSQVTYNVAIMPNFGNLDLAAAIMGTAASIDYTAINGVLSFAYKSYSGIVPLVTTDTQYNTLLLNGFNFYGIFDSAANTYDFTQNGSVGGIFKWFDFLCNNAWLTSTIQDSIATFFKSIKEVPNNEIGYNQIRTIINGIATTGINNGVIDVGNTFDAATTATLIQQAGLDITRFITQAGYYLQIVPVSATQRANRQPPKTTFWYSNSGSIIKLPITVTLVF